VRNGEIRQLQMVKWG